MLVQMSGYYNQAGMGKKNHELKVFMQTNVDLCVFQTLIRDGIYLEGGKTNLYRNYCLDPRVSSALCRNLVRGSDSLRFPGRLQQ